MIVGIGTDMCRISRLERAIGNAHFVSKVFSAGEIRYACSQGCPARHFASAYAAKEALAKASGLGMFGMGIGASRIERTDRGPVIICDETLQEKFERLGIRKSWLSLTHEGDYALAFVVLES